MRLLIRLLRALPLLIASPFILLISVLGIAATDLAWLALRRKRRPAGRRPSQAGASVVIPNWNGRDLLEKYLPYLEEAVAGNAANEIIVVDNGSTDGSAEFIRREHPRVRVLALEQNLGFGGGSNAGFQAAVNDIVVLLNSDMRVDREFLAPLLAGFTDEKVFAVSCQIFISDPAKRREETGLTQGWWQDGSLRVRHRDDCKIDQLYPCFYGGGGSCAFDRRKFLELGGLDPLLAPFYLEDTDLGYMAWKRGWKVFYQPASKVWHEHRGTIGKKFSEAEIQAVLKKNFILFCWKNIHEWPRLISHFFFLYAGALLSVFFGDEPGRANLEGMWRAFRQLRGAMASRRRARELAEVDDTEALRRPMGGYFRDRFADIPAEPEPLRALMVSPYPIYPPVHGGAVFMYQTLSEMTPWCEPHVVALLDFPWQGAAHREGLAFCKSVDWLVRMETGTNGGASMVPHAWREFTNPDLEWLMHRQIYLQRIDVVQLEYAPMGQYAGDFRRLACVLFEHDVYFESVARSLRAMGFFGKLIAGYEYLRALRWELRTLEQADRIQVCTRENRDCLVSFDPKLDPRIQEGLRAGIDTSRYEFRTAGRDAATMLFLGSFRHKPNRAALDWFVRDVLPRVLELRPDARLVVVGSDPPPEYTYAGVSDSIELAGFVEDTREMLARCTVFVCPILSGSGVRVKLLEAFAAGMPSVSTTLGAEGLARRDGEFCRLADDPAAFARSILDLFDNPEEAARMAARARGEVEANWDMAVLTRRLVESYRALLREKREETPA